MSARTATNAPPSDERRGRLLRRLEHLSVARGHDAFADVAWDEHVLAPDASDHPLGLWSTDLLAGTDWYAGLAPDARERLARARMAAMFRIGWEFENVLQRGLLAIAYRLPNRHPSFRYLHHEVVEESQHTLMFSEMVARLDPAARGMPLLLRRLGELLALPAATRLPELFYVFVLGGEIPIDHIQRQALRNGDDLHPLVAEVVRIHVEEESRHVSFARAEILAGAADLHGPRRWLVVVGAPVVLGIMVRLMVEPSPWVRRAGGVPDDVWREVVRSPRARAQRREAAARLLALLDGAALVPRWSRRLWRLAGIA